MVAVVELPRLPLPWTTAWGEDELGIWMTLDLLGVSQRMRWLNPGSFLMGSPADEPQRHDGERQHEVVLTWGFWLAETTCTQALWEAVMGENPSYFKGPQRPVEQVSWEDCRRFIDRVNHELPGLGLGLPTEAQWEYACRAGTTTPFSFGDTITTDQVNYHGNFPYAGGTKGEYRKETVAVRSLPANPWGLYEMHGNVLEWCADRYGPYPEVRAVDPRGPERGGSRVLRGGSWVSYGGYCRSAIRDVSEPGLRYGRIGFRLLRGQAEQDEQENK